MALVSAMLGVGGALGLPLAGLIGDNFDYHLLYWIGVVGAVVSIVDGHGVGRARPATTADRSIDGAGIVLLAGGLVCLVLPLSQGTAWGWGSVRTIGLLVASVVLLAALVVVERRVRNPLVDMAALANPPVADHQHRLDLRGLRAVRELRRHRRTTCRRRGDRLRLRVVGADGRAVPAAQRSS